MKENAKFQFQGFKIKKSSIELNTDEQGELDLDFNLSGVINKGSGVFELDMGVFISNDEKTVNIETIAVGNYSFPLDQEFENLKNFLYLNAPALLFPYVRAYISTLTALSGIKPITLPTMNLSQLKESLEANTTIIE